METEKSLESLIDQLNDALGDLTPYKLAVVDPKLIEHVSKNAHYMPKKMYDQLVLNVKADGNLSSFPFCWKREEDGKFISLSGNHRVDAAVDAKIEKIIILYTDEDLSRNEQVAIQLSHNSLVGLDNPTTLIELWDEIDTVTFKEYSGLDEEFLSTLEPVELLSPKDGDLHFEVLTLFFVPTEIGRIEDVIDKLTEAYKSRFVNDVKDFDAFFDKLLEYKNASGILNTSTAFAALIEVAAAEMERLEVERDGKIEHGTEDQNRS